MNNKRKLLLGLILVLMFNIGSIDFVVNGAVNAGTIHTKLSSPPVIDGYLNDTVWQNANQETYTLYDYTDQLNTVSIDIVTLYSSSDFLYIGAEVEETYTNSNGLILIFHVNESNDIIVDLEPSMEFGGGHDIKYATSDGQYADACTVGSSMTEDFFVGGTNELIAAGSYTNGKYTYEFEFPFDSGDTLGHDLTTSLSDQIKFFIFYESDVEFVQIRNDDVEWEYGIIDFIIPTTGAPLTVGCLTLVGLCLTVFIKKQKKEQ